LPAVDSVVAGNPMDIRLDCRALGMSGQASIQFTDMTNQSNVGYRLTPTADSTAKGVNVMLDVDLFGQDGFFLSESFRVLYAPPSSMYGAQNSHTLPLQPFNYGAFIIIRVRPSYIRSGNIVAGSANAMVMMTVAYK
ncbi:hypothetical protein, partial [Aeromonas hydrophila]|uniref:hypothetical protein n=1 Tax=Aeromonas hydrophila TaxID=644 RepID=UPI001F15AF77